ncbi:RNA polymerase RPO35 [Mythimna separata entomopoxvirus 'L']|uniref:RNA polymerase RPO35 n=1 Tax=Mythimna separata entomopoxvirus 'L' TaxID=1293572 RepID=A0A916NYE5_9POXV|nr:RNA polymerase RPO35 [Mythimna separata entomopoxvirus 'L']CCU56274.1 RNA polymerase RPO35 [Mythimna separata entomopoxvirus 'L']
MVFVHSIFSYKFTHIKEKKIYEICKAINGIFDEYIRIPTLSKTIIDPTHTLGVTYANIASQLAYVDILYLFNNNLDKLDNCGIYLHILNDASKKYVTYSDLKLFIFDDETGKIEIIKNPIHNDKHHIMALCKEKKCDESIGSSHVLCFSNTAKIEDNINLHNNIISTFDKYPIKNNLHVEIQNSSHYYKDRLLFQTPFNMWGMYHEDEDTYTINIRYNHYADINKNNIKKFITKVFTDIGDIFENTLIHKNILDYTNKINYSDIKHTKNYNYIYVNQDNRIESYKMDAICSVNDIPGINGTYLKPIDEEIIDSEETLNKNMRNIINELLNSFLKHIDDLYN